MSKVTDRKRRELKLRRFLRHDMRANVAIPLYCQLCHIECIPDKHHYDDEDGNKHWKNVMFLCRTCHKRIDKAAEKERLRQKRLGRAS